MIVTLFDQFMSPSLFGVPLLVIALTLPWLFFPTPLTRWLKARLLVLHAYLLFQIASGILSPLRPPGHKWALLFTSLTLFLITLNTLGLLPYTFTPTAQLSLNLGLAVPLWLATLIIGMRRQPTITLGHLLPEGTPTLLIPILIIIETISLFIRPLALGVRLTANLTAGHLLIHLASTAALAILSILPVLSLAAIPLLLLLTLLEIAVALIQAYVFVLLLALYLQENI